MIFIKIVLFVELLISFAVEVNIAPKEIRWPVAFWSFMAMFTGAAFLTSFVIK